MRVGTKALSCSGVPVSIQNEDRGLLKTGLLPNMSERLPLRHSEGITPYFHNQPYREYIPRAEVGKRRAVFARVNSSTRVFPTKVTIGIMAGWKGHFQGKKITVMGLGLLGRAVGDVEFLAQNGADMIVTDLKGDDALRVSLNMLKPYPNVTYRLGGHAMEDFKNRDFILKAAGIPFDSPYIAEAEKNGIPVKMSASWFAELSNIPVVGVTGTRGKSTTTAMLHDIMKASGMRVLLGGNIRGVSTLALLPEVTRESIALMELDSWQCRGFGDEKISPTVAIFTSFFDDHLNYYHGDRNHYLEDKAQIFLNQESSDTLIAPKDVAHLLKENYGARIRSTLVIADEKPLPKGWTLRVPGNHNILNAQCALAAARALGVDDDISRKALAGFKGVAGRLELVREIKEVKIYNDTTATTPEATIAGLRALDSGDKNIVLIMGGADKGLTMEGLISEAKRRAKKIILLSGSGTGTIKDRLPDAPLYERLDLALQDAIDSAEEGETVLFSPAFASFGMFKNEFDRGDQFIALVEKL